MKIFSANVVLAEAETTLAKTSTIAETLTKTAVVNDNETMIVSSAMLQSLNASLSESAQKVRSAKQQYMQADLAFSKLARDALFIQLDATVNPYAWATSTYSKVNLEMLDPMVQTIYKSILRDYFEPRGLTYEGWK